MVKRLALVLAAGMLAAISMAPASSAAARRITWYHICMAVNRTLCVQANGAGNNLSVVQGPGNKWQAIQDGSQIEWQNGSGNCMKATQTMDVTVISGGCDGGASKDWVVGGGVGRITFFSGYANGYMGTFGAQAGKLVFAEPAQTGFDSGWVTIGA